MTRKPRPLPQFACAQRGLWAAPSWSWRAAAATLGGGGREQPGLPAARRLFRRSAAMGFVPLVRLRRQCLGPAVVTFEGGKGKLVLRPT